MSEIRIEPVTGKMTTGGHDSTQPVVGRSRRRGEADDTQNPLLPGEDSGSTPATSDPLDSLTFQNVGGGAPVLLGYGNKTAQFRTLESGTGIHLESLNNTIKISVTGGGSGGGSDTFIGLTDTPSSFAGATNMFVKVNAAGDALEFANVATNFSALTDTPSSYSGQTGKYLRVNSTENGIEFVTAPSGGGASTFTALTDTPSSYGSNGGKFVAVNSGATALEFVDAPAGGTSTYEFIVEFGSSSPYNVTNVSSLPTGWSYTLNGSEVTITHTVNKAPKDIIYWGRGDLSGTLTWRLRFPTVSNEVTIPDADLQTKFTMRINATVAGADAGSRARVVVQF